ncbi:MAG: phage tail tape measure protein, partial [Candidatus Sulfotelmatobacter sp.]
MAGYSVTYSVVDNATKQIDAINRRVAQMRAPMERMQRSVTRFVDVSGLRKVATGFDWIYKAAGSVLRTLTAIVPVMGAITGAASIAGMVKLVQSYASWSHELVQAADNIGMTTQELQRFQDATRLAGGRAEDMTDGLKSLHDKISDLAIGKGNVGEAAQMLNRLGVNIRDANGHIRTAADLMPELVRKIGEMRDPADRARFATELLGAQGDKLVETFRQSSQSFSQWFNDVSRYKDLTDEQKRSLQLFTEAQGRLGVAFDRLGQQISAMVARDFGPLLTRFAEFVEKHTPEILAAVDKLSTQFAAWIGSIDWSKVEAGVNSFIESLKWLVNNLDTIKTVAEGIAILFATKWALGMVADIGKVVTSLGTAGGTTGLIGSLAAVTTAAGLAYLAWQKAQNPETYNPKNLSPNSPFW